MLAEWEKVVGKGAGPCCISSAPVAVGWEWDVLGRCRVCIIHHWGANLVKAHVNIHLLAEVGQILYPACTQGDFESK